MILREVLGDKAKIYHIYTDTTPRYICGSTGMTIWNDKLIMAIRMITHPNICGTSNWDPKYLRSGAIQYLINSICAVGELDLNFPDDDLIYLKTNHIQVLPTEPGWPYRGFEDGRLVVWDNKLYIYGTQFMKESPNATGVICYELNKDLNTIGSIYFPGLTDKGLINKPMTEKNWMAVPDKSFEFVYAIYNKLDGVCMIPKLYSDLNDPNTFNDVDIHNLFTKGSTPLQEYNNEYLCLVHHSWWEEGRLNYIHRLCFISKDFKSVRLSEPFKFEQPGIEFTTGLCIYNDKLYLTYSTNDGTSNLLITKPEDLINVVNGENYGSINMNPKRIAERLFKINPMDSAQYYWSDWLQNHNTDSLYSHFAISLYYLDLYLIGELPKEFENDNSIDSTVLKLYHLRRTSRNFDEYYKLMNTLPHGWMRMIKNKYIKQFAIDKLIM